MPTRAADDPGIRDRVIELRLERLALNLGRQPIYSGNAGAGAQHCDFCTVAQGDACSMSCSSQVELWKARL